MQEQANFYVRKRDFVITFKIPEVDEVSAGDLSRAVVLARPSYVHNILLLEIKRPVDTDVHRVIEQICLNGVDCCVIETLHPVLRDLPVGRRGHLILEYSDGVVLDHALPLSADDDGDEALIDILEIGFKRKRIVTNCWEAEKSHQPVDPEENVVRLFPSNSVLPS